MLPLFTTILSVESSNATIKRPTLWSFDRPKILPTHCAFASVGGGWAGIYAAWRVAVNAKKIPADQVCVFEASTRFGGRTYTVRGGDQILEGLNIDVGAYRFAFEQHREPHSGSNPELPFLPVANLVANLVAHSIPRVDSAG